MPVVECLTQDLDKVAVGPALHRERPLTRRGQHLQRVQDLGRLVHPAQPGQSRTRQHDGVELARRDLAQPGVHVAADADELDPQAQGLELGDPARGAGAHARARGQLTEGEPVTGDDDVTGVLTHGNRSERDPLRRGGGEVLEGVHRHVDVPLSSASRRALTKTPVPPMVARGAVLRSPSVRMVTSSVTRPVAALSWSATSWLWVRASVLARVPTRMVPCCRSCRWRGR